MLIGLSNISNLPQNGQFPVFSLFWWPYLLPQQWLKLNKFKTFTLWLLILIMPLTLWLLILIMPIRTNLLKPFLAHLSHWLMVRYCDRWMSVVYSLLSVVHRQQLLQMTSPKLLAGV